MFSASLLAHTDVLLTVLKALAAFKRRPIEPIIYVLAARPRESECREFEQSFAACDVSIRYRNAEEIDTVLWLPRQCAEDQISAAVWVSLPLELSFWTSYRVAPAQIWWSMKYHDLDVAGVDGYLTLGSQDGVRMMNGRKWRSCRSAMPPLFDATKTSTAQSTRAQYSITGSEVFIGSMAREVRYLD